MTHAPSLPAALRLVRVVGTGLLGTSMALAWREQGVRVGLDDQSPSARRLAEDYGAGVAWSDSLGSPDLVVVAVPPDVTATVVAQELDRFPEAIVIDVASVKGAIRRDLDGLGVDMARYIGTHPMAGRERGGAMAARVDLFTGRPWVLCPSETTPSAVVEWVEGIVRAFGATVSRMSVDDHDAAVAAVSHVPQVISSAMAAQLEDVSPPALSLAGQGVRDVTRIAASDSGLWLQILTQNAPAVKGMVGELIADLTALHDALGHLDEPGSRRLIAEFLARGQSGVGKLPGKHGLAKRFASLVVVIDDRPGQLASLLADVGSLNVNVEDMVLEHSPGAEVGFVELWVTPDVVHQLGEDLVERGWRIAGERA